MFFGLDSFYLLNIVGEYASLQRILANKLNTENNNALDALNQYCKRAEAKNKAVLIVVDEFGKVLEHAAKNNPEEELYFIQQFCEILNDYRRKAILLTTLHQNFSSYASKLSESQRQEWQKVKGRFKEIVFSEPVEQLLYLASEQLALAPEQKANETDFATVYALAKQCRFISDSFSEETARKLNPIDPLAASCLTQAIQKYGQNERSSSHSSRQQVNIRFSNYVKASQTLIWLTYIFMPSTFYSEIFPGQSGIIWLSAIKVPWTNGEAFSRCVYWRRNRLSKSIVF